MLAFRVIICLALITAVALAQERGKNEVGLLLAGISTPDANTAGTTTRAVDIGTGLSLQATYARRLAGNGTALYFEVPFVAMPNANVRSGAAQVIEAYAALFVTPGVRVKFASGGKLSPWLAIGGGYGQFEESTRDQLRRALPPQRTHTGALQLGGGIDVNTGIKLLFPVSLRGEVRDFYSGAPGFNVAVDGARQHNVVLSGGLVLHF